MTFKRKIWFIQKKVSRILIPIVFPSIMFRLYKKNIAEHGTYYRLYTGAFELEYDNGRHIYG